MKWLLFLTYEFRLDDLIKFIVRPGLSRWEDQVQHEESWVENGSGDVRSKLISDRAGEAGLFDLTI